MASTKRKPTTKPKRQTFHPTQAQHLSLAASDGAIVPNKTPVTLKAQNAAQRFYLKTLEYGTEPYVVAHGPAGTGKTYMAVIHAANALKTGTIRKLIITRPMVGAGEDLGFLPGDVTNKVLPWCIPLIDALEEAFSPIQVAKMIETKVVEIAPIGLMRGRTLKGALVIADEAQNLTPEQMKMLLTRLGNGSRMIITGDVEQHDRGYAKSGLADLIEKIECNERLQSRTALHEFKKADSVRHEAIEDVLEAYA